MDRTYTILLVDDDETITWTLTAALQRVRPGMKIYQAHSGLEAFGYIKQLKHLDLLITDIHMPQLTGIELLEKLQTQGIQPAIIVITGFGTPAIHQQVEKLGAVRYFAKPFDLHILTKTAMQILDHRHEINRRPGFTGQFGNLKMVDIIQINSLMRQTGLLLIEAGSQTGWVYFCEGEVVHSRTEDETGEEALYSIMGWGSGKFDFKDQVAPVDKTIQKSWEFLLMEHAQRVEKKNRSF